MQKTTFFILSIITLFGCTEDRNINDPVIDPSSVLIHYWNFNAISGTVTSVSPDFTLLPTANPAITYEGTSAGYMDSFSPGYTTNAQNSDLAGSGLRARNPSDTRYLLLSIPTTGFQKIIVQFATAASSSGAQIQNYSYTIDGTNYSTDGLNTTTFNTTVDPIMSLVSLDFSSITAVNNNPNFKIKISFSGSNASGTTGNNRFDNVTVLGVSAPPSNLGYAATNNFTLNSPIVPLNPTVNGNVTSYSVSPSLPSGLTLNTTTGVISGTPTQLSTATNYTITASNNSGSTTFIISIAVSAVVDNTVYLVHYWNFNSLPSGTLTTINADSSLITSSTSTITYQGTGAGYMDQYASTTTLNAQNGDISGLGLRFRNPSDTRNVIIMAPTTGYKNVVMKFATARSSTSGASIQNYSYSLDGVNFITTGLTTTTFNPNIDPTYDIVTIDFSAIIGANNNPNFVVKINFGGPEASGISGNNRIDNITFQANHI